MPRSPEPPGPADGITDHLSETDRLFWGVFKRYPQLTPIPVLELMLAKYPTYPSHQPSEYDLTTEIRPALSRLRTKLTPGNLMIYSIHHFHSFFLGPLKAGGALTLSRLPEITPGQPVPQEPKSLLKPFYLVTITSLRQTSFRTGPFEFKALLALINQGVNQPLSYKDLYMQIYADREDLASTSMPDWANNLRPFIYRLRPTLINGWDIVMPKKMPGYYQLINTREVA